MKAFILAAGLGTRLKPLTDSKPKALIELNGIPILELVIKRLIKFGFEEIIINVHHLAEQIIDFLITKNFFNIDIKISDEKNLLLDTGGALKKASSLLKNKTFLLHNVDIISTIKINKFLEYHLSQNSIATLAVQKRESSRYLLFDERKYLCGWKNTKTNETKIVRDPSGMLNEYAFSGIHFIEPSIFKYFPDKNVFSIIDFYLTIASNEKITYYDHTDSLLIDLGKKENLIIAEKILSNII